MKLRKPRIDKILAKKNAEVAKKMMPYWGGNTYMTSYGTANQVSVAVTDSGGLKIVACCGEKSISKDSAASLARFLSDPYL